MFKPFNFLFKTIAFLLFSGSLFANEFYEQELLQLRKDWATIKYEVSIKDKQLKAFEALIHRAEILNHQHPHQPRIMVWYATILSSYSALKGGLGVLPQVKKARTLLEEAIYLSPNVEQGLAQGVLGTLYARVPGWPIAFGNKEKAVKYLQNGVKINPHGSDANYYYGDYLINAGQYKTAKQHLLIAQHAPVREAYAVQDQGRKHEINDSFNKLHKLGYY